MLLNKFNWLKAYFFIEAGAVSGQKRTDSATLPPCTVHYYTLYSSVPYRIVYSVVYTLYSCHMVGWLQGCSGCHHGAAGYGQAGHPFSRRTRGGRAAHWSVYQDCGFATTFCQI